MIWMLIGSTNSLAPVVDMNDDDNLYHATNICVFLLLVNLACRDQGGKDSAPSQMEKHFLGHNSCIMQMSIHDTKENEASAWTQKP